MLDSHGPHVFIFRNTTVDQLTEVAVALAGMEATPIETRTILSVQPEEITIDTGVFTCRTADGDCGRVVAVQAVNCLTVSSADPMTQKGVLTDSESALQDSH